MFLKDVGAMGRSVLAASQKLSLSGIVLKSQLMAHLEDSRYPICEKTWSVKKENKKRASKRDF